MCSLMINDVLDVCAHCTLLGYIALQVELCRHFNFKYAKKRLPDDIIPIISANMDTIGTFEMAMALAEVNISLLQK